ncbi:MAG TPA: ABC transporter ATP-binding protein [Phycisphaerae bacterium]|nr:ABC transporter ATP-binding protein [Phycisphaerae bacterium]
MRTPSPTKTEHVPGSGRAVVALKGVSRSFGTAPHSVEAVRSVNLTISAGQFVLIAGPSGSGKTTLLTIMGLLLPPTTGSVTVLGHDVSGGSETSLAALRRRHVSFIFQSFNLLSALTAEENVQVGLELQGIRRQEAMRWSRELLERVGLAARARHRPADMSGGEKQRVGVARALGSPAELLLADEPTGSLDSGTARPLVELLRRMAHEEGRAVVVVTHDMRLEPLADRVIRMEDGRIIADESEVRK